MKIVLIGETQVGKTSMISRLVNGRFNEDNPATIGASLNNFCVQTKYGAVTLQIWDTAGHEKYRALTPMYYRSANVAIMCYDITNKDSFDKLYSWSQELADKGPQGLKTVVVGTKKDLEENRAVSTDTAQEFAYDRQASFFMEVSSKTGENILQLFQQIGELNETDLTAQEEPPINMIPNDSDKSKGCC